MTLAEWLKSTETTQVAFAERTGIPQSEISKYARLARRPDIDNALAIERATAGEVPVEAWARAVPDEDIGAAAAPASPAVPVAE